MVANYELNRAVFYVSWARNISGICMTTSLHVSGKPKSFFFWGGGGRGGSLGNSVLPLFGKWGGEANLSFLPKKLCA